MSFTIAGITGIVNDFGTLVTGSGAWTACRVVIFSQVTATVASAAIDILRAPVSCYRSFTSSTRAGSLFGHSEISFSVTIVTNLFYGIGNLPTSSTTVAGIVYDSSKIAGLAIYGTIMTIVITAFANLFTGSLADVTCV